MRMWWWCLLAGLVVTLGCAAPVRAWGVPEGGTPGELAPPVRGAPEVVRPFEPPAERWRAGHRGVDVAAPVGGEILATANGVVSFVGRIAGRNVLVIDHGEVRTTYEPVSATVPVGTRVRAGQVVGRLDEGHDCGRAGVTCVHVGLRQGEDYLAPVFVVAAQNTVRLLPEDAAEAIEARAAERAAAAAAAAAAAGDGGPPPAPGSSGLVRPAAGPITSRFGMRRHPVLGVWKLHDGTDFGLPCGAPLRAVAAGRVTQSYFNAGYGNRLFIDHGSVNGRRLMTSYNHAIRFTVGVGEHVSAGQVIGLNGTTGYSTGCHLHLMMWVDGRLVDPERWL
ncbi:peptidoglycan DD-metalloendopeptidase family protein [Granulicoccus sp. GXG6511]|uniref:peptidoglycan DD-metalloendopeptidase family protein n=1 Tax=Granulicoccus sp. GXG6511 TaxID=3381351 RepID=UPI003D7D28A0